MELKYDGEGQIIPAMPENPFDEADTLTTLWSTNTIPEEYRESSLAVQYKVRNVPLKPLPQHVQRQGHKNALLGGTDKLDTMHPKELLSHNIGNNQGLARIMRLHYEEKKQDIEGMCKEYSAFNTDINIFDRVIKVHTSTTTWFFQVPSEGIKKKCGTRKRAKVEM